MKTKAPSLNFIPRGLFIGGQWQQSQSGQEISTINPSTGEKLGCVPLANAGEVDLAVTAAAGAAPDWGRIPTRERAVLLNTLANRLAEHRQELGLMDCLDGGNALSGMIADVDWAVDSLRYFAGLIGELKGETFSRQERHLNLTWRQPYGVVAKINPFNHPFRFCAEKAAAPLAAGNTVVIKGSEQAPLSSLRFAEICQDVLPPGVINVITGDASTGQALVSHPLVRRIGVVGSVETGKAVLKEAAADIKHVSLELGGKNPIIIFPDADPIEAAKLAIKGMNMNRQGQSCSSTSRVFVHESLHQAVREELVKLSSELPVGLPWLAGIEVGPVVSEKQYQRVCNYIDSGLKEGGELLTGGVRPTELELTNGFFIRPAIFDGITMDMRIAREEIFGPVMSIITWNDQSTMLKQVNQLDFGLTAMIVTESWRTAMATAEQVEAGYVWINSSGRYLGAPYGGWKHSGLGQEECLDELLSYTRTKNINMAW
ncbi:MAG: aldehyde dehydrogenase family protein [Pelovirga sp.]